MHFKLFGIVFVLAVIHTMVVSGFYSSEDEVITLTSTNFDELVTKSNSVFLVEFYSPDCFHCKNLAPEYIKVAKALKGRVKVGAIDASTEKALQTKYKITSYPKILIFHGKYYVEQYNGKRDAQAIFRAAKNVYTKRILKKSNDAKKHKRVKKNKKVSAASESKTDSAK